MTAAHLHRRRRGRRATLEVGLAALLPQIAVVVTARGAATATAVAHRVGTGLVVVVLLAASGAAVPAAATTTAIARDRFGPVASVVVARLLESRERRGRSGGAGGRATAAA